MNGVGGRLVVLSPTWFPILAVAALAVAIGGVSEPWSVVAVMAVALGGAVWGGWHLGRSQSSAKQAEAACVAREQELSVWKNELHELVETLDEVVKGNLSDRADGNLTGELGLLAAALNRFVEKVQGVSVALEMTADALVMSAEGITDTAQQLGASADETHSEATVVAAAADQVSKNSVSVAAGTEQMSVSITQISKHAAEAAKVAEQAVQVAAITNEKMAKLGESSTEIGHVTDLINSIAGQTNLLALNATIEAARAGEAGKGFAVVANEIKELARETAMATENIGKQIGKIQTEAAAAVEAIAQIGQIVTSISESQNAIAVAVDEQTATAAEMARSVNEAARGSTDIARSISGVAQAAQNIADNASRTQENANLLVSTASDIRSAIGALMAG